MADLGFEETELRLGLPGGNDAAGDAAAAAARKRGFEETIDLKLKLEQPAAAAHVEEDEQQGQREAGAGDVDVPAATPMPSPPAATIGGAGTTMKRSPSQGGVVTAADAQPADPEKPRAPKAQAVGWPPVRSFRKNILAVHQSQRGGGDDGKVKPLAPAPAAFVKVSMDGAPYLRKVDLRTYGSYQELSKALHNMFTIGSCRPQKGMMNETTKLQAAADLVVMSGSDEYVPTYEDKDGDWMLVGDVPWEMFVESCKRVRVMKGSEAVGLGHGQHRGR